MVKWFMGNYDPYLFFFLVMVMVMVILPYGFHIVIIREWIARRVRVFLFLTWWALRRYLSIREGKCPSRHEERFQKSATPRNRLNLPRARNSFVPNFIFPLTVKETRVKKKMRGINTRII